MEDGSSLNPMVPAHLSTPLITGLGIGTETCGVGSVFAPDDLWIGLDTYTSCEIFTQKLTDGVCHLNSFILICLTYGERDGLWWAALSGY